MHFVEQKYIKFNKNETESKMENSKHSFRETKLVLEKFDSWSVLGELQLTQTSLNFKTSCSNLKIRGLGAKLCMAVKESVHIRMAD